MPSDSVTTILQTADGPVVLVGDAAAGRNVMPALVEAVKAYASVGEMTKELVGVFGRYQEPIRF